DSERFAGAVRTYSCEGLMQDNRALQAGTSHFLGQNFAKAFDTTFQTAEGGIDHVWSTSWGVSTRLVGGLIMTHSDDRGLICPPRLAQYQVVLVPIYRKEADRTMVLEAAGSVRDELRNAGIRVHVDDREGMTPGARYYEWEARGAPFRLELGPRDLAAGTAMLARRTGGDKTPLKLEGIAAALSGEIQQMQSGLLTAARSRREANSRRGLSKAEFIGYLAGGGGFVYGGWCGEASCENEVKEQTKATVRVLPEPEFRSEEAPKTCQWCDRPSLAEAVRARAY
ncbi:MAG: proline--tRNA ligase, partial [Gemmatimonadales bacterium]